MKIGASIDRDLKVAFMGAGDTWHGGTDISLTKDKLKSVSRIIKLEDKEIIGTLAFQISLGQVGETELAAHAVEISDISLTKVESDTTAGEEIATDQMITSPETEEESNLEETDIQDKRPALEEDSNLETDITSDVEESESTTEEESPETETESETEEESPETETESETEEESPEIETESETESSSETKSETEEESFETETESETEESFETETESETESSSETKSETEKELSETES